MAPHPLIVRRDAAQATLDRFRGQPFAWGRVDCGKMLHFHLRQLGRAIALGEASAYTTLLGATRALRKLGHASLPDALDAHFPQVAPAAAIVGDALALEADTPLGAITIALGNGRVLGFHEEAAGAEVLQPHQVLAAWRLDPA